MKLKRKGFILFIYWEGCRYHSIETGEWFCNSKRELKDIWHNHWDDKWDVEERNKIHYFYLDVAKGEYFPLPKWKNDYDPEKGFEQCTKKELSTKMF